ncbi:MAG: hypothetical protein G01um101416_649 [Microgenomates group bacterium Gr01-1014_16]|nr:MAG: hypothetical protein G01um101416_649 [Microgenomates group bacterium Gr01-1014_16]
MEDLFSLDWRKWSYRVGVGVGAGVHYAVQLAPSNEMALYLFCSFKVNGVISSRG